MSCFTDSFCDDIVNELTSLNKNHLKGAGGGGGLKDAYSAANFVRLVGKIDLGSPRLTCVFYLLNIIPIMTIPTYFVFQVTFLK